MELLNKSGLSISLTDDVLEVEKSSGFLCFAHKEVQEFNLRDVVNLQCSPDNQSIALCTASDSLSLTKIPPKVCQTIKSGYDKVKSSIDLKVLVEKKTGMIFPNILTICENKGILVFVTNKRKCGWCGHYIIETFSILMDEIVVFHPFKHEVFISTENHAINVKGLTSDQVNNLEESISKQAKKNLKKCLTIKSKFSLNPFSKKEYLFETPKGVGYFVKSINKESIFRFVSYDDISHLFTHTGCFTGSIVLLAENPIIPKKKFWRSALINFKKAYNTHKDPEDGEIFEPMAPWRWWSNKRVVVTDTHVVCLGDKNIVTLQKPYEDGKSKGFLFLTVSLEDYKIKHIWRYTWKKFLCCFGGRMKNEVEEAPSRELLGEAEKKRF